MALMGIRITACTPRRSYPGVLQDFPSACEKYNESHQIAVEGYLRLPDTLTSTTSVELRLYRDLRFQGRPIGVPMLFGDSPNEAHKIVTSFRDEDLKVHLADGAVVPFRTRVRVSGRMHIPVGPTNFSCELEDPYVEEAK